MSKKQKREIRSLKLENRSLQSENVHYFFKISVLESQISEAIGENEELQGRLKKLENRGLWGRIWNR